MQARHVRRMRDAKLATPAGANQLLKALRALFSWANEAEETTVNPTIGVKKLKYHSDGHHTWTDEEIQQFYKRHPLGSQARLALDLLRFTTCRREDVPRLAASTSIMVEFAFVRQRTSTAIRLKSTFRCIQT